MAGIVGWVDFVRMGIAGSRMWVHEEGALQGLKPLVLVCSYVAVETATHKAATHKAASFKAAGYIQRCELQSGEPQSGEPQSGEPQNCDP
jgi:hypothetical protein